jgi:GNAT superfamily N-acetyltransferase
MTMIETVKDKNGDELKLLYSETIANTPALALFLKIYAEIVEKGWSNPNIPFSNKNSVVWVERPDGTVAGGICFEYVPSTALGWIILSFTASTERGKGINSLLHPAFEKIVKRMGAQQIASLVHIDNKSRLRSSEKVGLVPQYYRMYKKL